MHRPHNASVTRQPFEIRVKPQRDLRNDQLGDYFRDAYGVEQFTIANTGDYFSTVCVLVHELVEQALCREHGISEQAIDRFDDDHRELDEPGDDRRAPYHREHAVAMRIERMLVRAAGISWAAYCRRLAKVTSAR